MYLYIYKNNKYIYNTYNIYIYIYINKNENIQIYRNVCRKIFM